MAERRKVEAAEARPEAAPPAEDQAGSTETVVVETTEEPVRRGGYILTNKGWILEAD